MILPNNKVDAALVGLLVLLGVPVPLDSASSALAALLAQALGDGDGEVN